MCVQIKLHSKDHSKVKKRQGTNRRRRDIIIVFGQHIPCEVAPLTAVLLPSFSSSIMALVVGEGVTTPIIMVGYAVVGVFVGALVEGISVSGEAEEGL